MLRQLQCPVGTTLKPSFLLKSCPMGPRLHTHPLRAIHVGFFGTDEVSLQSLRVLHESLQQKGPHPGLITQLSVICPGDRKMGRGQKLQPVPVKEFALQHGLATEEVPAGIKDLRLWESSWFPREADSRTGPASRAPRFDIGVVVSFGYFMRPHILAQLKQGTINMHPSLLPRHRGAAPIEHTLLQGDAETGVSIISIHPEKFDAGLIYMQRKAQPVPQPQEGCKELTERLAGMGAGMVLETVANFATLQAVAQPQPSTGATLARKLQQDMGRVRWQEGEEVAAGMPDLDCFRSPPTAEGLLRMSRAFNDAFGVYSFLSLGKPAALKRVRLLQLSEVLAGGPEAAALQAVEAAAAGGEGKQTPAAGTLHYLKQFKRLFLRARDAWVAVDKLQPETRGVMTGADFANGYRVTGSSGSNGDVSREAALVFSSQGPAAGERSQ